ncbi:MAG: hypothetical protein GXO04_03165 [Aquificae bacterium]|nr:hypothetical protein [Aquificota bacterium]
MFLNKEEVEKRLKEVLQELNKYDLPSDVYLILVGSASLMLKYNLKRSTRDIDVVVRPYIGGLGDILARKGFQLVAEGFLNLHPDYEERLQPLWEIGKVHVFALSPYDLAISKISRGLDKDISDILESDLIKEIDFEKLKKLYFEASEHWVGDRRKFKWAWEDFESAYRRKFEKTFRKGSKPR